MDKEYRDDRDFFYKDQENPGGFPDFISRVCIDSIDTAHEVGDRL
jgi:hypothetical protein